MRIKNTTKGIIGLAIILLLTATSKASTFVECKSLDIKSCAEVTKGQAIKIMMQDPKAIVLKVDQQKFDDDKGSLKAKPK